MPSGTTMFLNAVWGSSGTDAFVVGDNGTILHYNGSSWASMLKVTTKLLNGVWGSGGSDVFVIAFNPNASGLLYSTYFGGAANDYGYGIAVDPAGNAYVVGQTSSYDFPVVGAFQPAFAGLVDAFVAKIQPDAPRLVATLVGGSLQLKWLEYPPGYVLETASPLTAAATWTAVSQTPVNANGWRTVTLPASGAGGFFRLHHP